MYLNRSRISAALLGVTMLTGSITSVGLIGQSANAQTQRQLDQQIVETQRYCRSREAKAEHRPICNAFDKLVDAREALQRGEPKYNGYRLKAMQNTNAAIINLIQALNLK
jgi:hypothetical protein